MKGIPLAGLMRLVAALLLWPLFPFATHAAEPPAVPNVVVTNDAPGVQVEGSFARIEAAQSRSATVLQSVGGGAHRVRFVADPGYRGYYRVLLWWPQAGVRRRWWCTACRERSGSGDAGPAQRPVAAGRRVRAAGHRGRDRRRGAAGAPLVVDALRLQYVGATPPPRRSASCPSGGDRRYAVHSHAGDRRWHAPLVFNVDAANLPPGLDFDAVTGTLAGVPQTPGHYRFDVEVFDHNGARVQQEFELHVVAASKGSSAATRR